MDAQIAETFDHILIGAVAGAPSGSGMDLYDDPLVLLADVRGVQNTHAEPVPVSVVNGEPGADIVEDVVEISAGEVVEPEEVADNPGAGFSSLFEEYIEVLLSDLARPDVTSSYSVNDDDAAGAGLAHGPLQSSYDEDEGKEPGSGHIEDDDVVIINDLPRSGDGHNGDSGAPDGGADDGDPPDDGPDVKPDVKPGGGDDAIDIGDVLDDGGDDVLGGLGGGGGGRVGPGGGRGMVMPDAPGDDDALAPAPLAEFML